MRDCKRAKTKLEIAVRKFKVWWIRASTLHCADEGKETRRNTGIHFDISHFCKPRSAFAVKSNDTLGLRCWSRLNCFCRCSRHSYRWLACWLWSLNQSVIIHISKHFTGQNSNQFLNFLLEILNTHFWSSGSREIALLRSMRTVQGPEVSVTRILGIKLK
jgi:hypothetical protein